MAPAFRSSTARSRRPGKKRRVSRSDRNANTVLGIIGCATAKRRFGQSGVLVGRDPCPSSRLYWAAFCQARYLVSRAREFKAGAVIYLTGLDGEHSGEISARCEGGKQLRML